MRAAFFACLFFATHSFAGNLGYDPKADPFEQYHTAVAQAEAQNKLVLIVAGGDWCRWCYALDRFVKRIQKTSVISAKAGTHPEFRAQMGSRLRGNDG